MEIWERQPKETTKAYAAFCIYRDMGEERTLAKVCTQMEKVNGYNRMLQEWSRKNNWVSRCEAYDIYLEQEKRRTAEKERIKMHERHAKQAMVFQQKMQERLLQLDPATLSPSDLIKFFDIAVKVERLARGEFTEKISQEHTGKDGGPIDINKTMDIDLSSLSDEELEVLERIALKSNNNSDIGGNKD